ncbi:MAG: hypothetical protein Q9198_007506, partial [Flavoplaca austrocitrina]
MPEMGVSLVQQPAYPMNRQTWMDQHPTNTSHDALTTSSISVRRHRRHLEIPGHVRAHNASHKCRMVVKSKHRSVSSAPLTARIDSTFRAGVISKDKAEDMRGVQEKCLAAKATRVQNLRKARTMINNKAKEDAKLKALERAIEEQSSSLPLILSLPYAVTFITNPAHAKAVFNHLQVAQADPLYVHTLSNKHQKGVRLLLRQENKLRKMVEATGSLESALAYQDERVALMKHRQALRNEFLLADEGVQELLRDENPSSDGNANALNDYSTTLVGATPSTTTYRSVLDVMTEHQKAADQQTAIDLIAWKDNHNLRLTRKRKNRLESAKRVGRTDLCAMEMENRLQKAETLDATNCEETIKTEAFEAIFSTNDVKQSQADDDSRLFKRRRHGHFDHQDRDPKIKEELQVDESARARTRRAAQGDTYRLTYRRSDNTDKPRKGGRHNQATGNAKSEAQTYRRSYRFLSE